MSFGVSPVNYSDSYSEMASDPEERSLYRRLTKEAFESLEDNSTRHGNSDRASVKSFLAEKVLPICGQEGVASERVDTDTSGEPGQESVISGTVGVLNEPC